jgi:hypothetical protein
MRRALTAIALVLLVGGPASAGSRYVYEDDDYAYDDAQVAAPGDGESYDGDRRDLRERSPDLSGRVERQQRLAPMQPYWGTMRPYWNAPEPPGVIHRGARTRGLK